MQKKQKEFMDRQLRADLKILEYMFIIQPVGVVAALVPWNFPAVLSSRKISTALAAGCSVIVKPDVITPWCRYGNS